MLRAGALAIATMGADTGEYERVALVYRAMASVAPQQSRRTTRRPRTSWKSCESWGRAAATSDGGVLRTMVADCFGCVRP